MDPSNADTKVICTHNEDANSWNDVLMSIRYPHATAVFVRTNADSLESAAWANREGFHRMKSVAVGCPMMLTKNVDISIGAVNGAFGKVTGFHEHEHSGEVYRIYVRLDNGECLRVYRNVYERLYFSERV